VAVTRGAETRPDARTVDDGGPHRRGRWAVDAAATVRARAVRRSQPQRAPPEEKPRPGSPTRSGRRWQALHDRTRA